MALHRGLQLKRWLLEPAGQDLARQLVWMASAHEVTIRRSVPPFPDELELVAFALGELTLVLCAGVTHPRLPTVGGLRTLYGMTPSEAYVAGALAADQSPKEIAADLGLSLSTVRTHLFAVRTKIGAASQTDLLRRLLGSAAVYGPSQTDLPTSPERVALEGLAG